MEKELSTEECLVMLDELARLKVFQINLGGGEPFARPDIFRILNYAERLGIVSCVSTNGSLVNTEMCQRLADMDGLFLQVSLDGADEATNDKIRGAGTYMRARRGIDELARHGISFSINTVLTSLSFPQIDTLKSMAEDVGAHLRVSRFRPSGRAKDCWTELAPTKEQLECFTHWLKTESAVLTGDSFFSLTSEKRRRMGLDMCGAAKMTCCLSPDGSIYPCAFLQERDFIAGNIRETGLEQVWLHSEIFRSMRVLEVRSCEACFRFESCRGGCPAMAYHAHGDLAFPDPECLVRCLAVHRA
jgi:mycofactocin radical SAM maturase